MSRKPRYHFVCQRCTACCKWPGDVRINDAEITGIASFLGVPDPDFIEKFTRIRGNRTGLSLRDKEGTTECVMLDGDRCRIHDVKPLQCRGFPNTWNFPEWEKECEAIAVPLKEEA